MRNLVKPFLMLVVILSSSNAMSTGWTEFGDVINVGSNNTYVKLSLSASGSYESNCSGSNFRVRQSDNMAAQALSIALTAYAANKKIRVSASGCASGSILINDIEIQN